MRVPLSHDEVPAMDAADPLAGYRDQFLIPEGLVYLDGNSLGPLPRATSERVRHVVNEEWGRELIRAWTSRGWLDLPELVARGIASLIGAAADEVMVADSTSVNLFKLIAAGLRLRPDRKVVLSESQNFPTDLYMAQGFANCVGQGISLRLVDRTEIDRNLDPDTAILMLTHVDFKTGEMHDMARLTAAAHDAGALVLWDLSHSVGAVPIDLGGCAADLAVGCGYKYLNGGPGAPAFTYVARRHHDRLQSPLWGWMGHNAPFEFSTSYRPAPGVARLRVGTPAVLGLAALECGVAIAAEIGIHRLRAKSIALTDFFIGLVDRSCTGHGVEVVTPRNSERRGSQVSLRHPEGHSIVQAMISAGVIGDYRPPDLLRFGFAPSYLRFEDVWTAVSVLETVLTSGSWDEAQFRERGKVT